MSKISSHTKKLWTLYSKYKTNAVTTTKFGSQDKKDNENCLYKIFIKISNKGKISRNFMLIRKWL